MGNPIVLCNLVIAADALANPVFGVPKGWVMDKRGNL